MSLLAKLPHPLGRMFEYLNIDIERSALLVPKELQAAAVRCRQCDKFLACDFNIESRYFLCPNRELLDRLEEMLA